MNGAREYAGYFETGQYGRLYIVSGQHARGKIFFIYILPKDETAIPNGPNNPPLNKNTVCVYGILSGQPGWTEEYGWLHFGLWQKDFEQLLVSKIMEREAKEKELKKQTDEEKNAEQLRIQTLLKEYK